MMFPERRECTHQTFKIHTENGPVSIHFTVGFDVDGSVKEIFIVRSKTGTTERALLDVIARLVSVGLQSGTSLRRYKDMFMDTKFGPSGPVTGHAMIKFCLSPLDLLARWIDVEFLRRST